MALVRDALVEYSSGPMATTRPDDCLVILHVSSWRITGTVAWLQEAVGERVVAHRSLECRWPDLDDGEREQALYEALQLASQSAGVDPYSVFVSISDETVRANHATGYADLGQVLTLTREERDLALARAGHQPIGTNRVVLHALPLHWSVRDVDGEREVDDPVGHRGMRLACNVLLVTAERDNMEFVGEVLGRRDIHLEGMIAPPVALYRGLGGHLPRRGSTLIIDCGARHTSFLVHRKGRLVHLETHRFGGDDLTAAIAEELDLGLEAAEAVKRELDIGTHGSRDVEGQTYLWREVQERSRRLGPAALVCSSLLRQFFRDRFQHLRDLELFAQQGRIHLVGRGAALGGLASLLRDIFDMEVVLGTRRADREPGSELSDLITVGLVRTAADERARQLAERSGSGIRQVATAAGGFWSWLTARLS